LLIGGEMAKKTRSIVLVGPDKMEMREFDIPKIGPKDGLLKVLMCGVCGSDPKTRHQGFNVPLIMGHEMFGYIAEIGEEASKRWGVVKGDQVVVESSVPCGVCPLCLEGNIKFCPNKQSYGVFTNSLVPPYLWGGYGEYMYLAPNAVVYKVAKSLPPEIGILITSVLANGIQWIRIRGGASIQNSVVIQGSGPQGLAATIAAKESGASPIIITGMTPGDEEKFALAKEYGADYTIDIKKENVTERVKEITEGKMADLVLDVTGNPEGISKSVELVGKMGTMILGSLTMGKPITFISDKLCENEIKLQGVLSSGGKATLAAIKLAESRKYALEKMVTHKYPLNKGEEAVRAAGREIPGIFPIKAVIVP
jgi:alcohol dehydrogenase